MLEAKNIVNMEVLIVLREINYMQFTYEVYKKTQGEKKSSLVTNFKRLSNVLSDIPMLGNTLKTSADLVTENIENKTKFNESFTSKEKDTSYFVLGSNNYYGELFEKVFKILEIGDIQKLFDFDISNLKVSIDEWYLEEDDSIEDVLSIDFFDDVYINDRTGNEEMGNVFVSFKESFKQVNFEDNSVHTVFETIALGINHHQRKRNYGELAHLICHFLSNDKLLK